ncbi:MAG: hypothetical protein H6Q91_83 [Deltaproteobacteria bacterium]|nr:hypothetical protein [Deltaproteobacteria bacterium]
MNTRSLAVSLACAALIGGPSRAAEGTPAATPEAAAPAAAAPKAPPPVAQDPNESYGFKITRQLVDRAKIIAGGPGRDGIHAVDAPSFAGPEAADAIAPETPVIGVSIGGDARAYPIPILEYHQIVNDTVGGVPVAVSYDPLTGAPLAWKRSVGGRTLRFGVSGLVYNSGFLLYDHETESLWSQFNGRAIAGALAGKTLEPLPLRQENFASWLAREAKTKILIPPEPNHYDYNQSAYATYVEEDGGAFPVEARDRRFHAKELMVGVAANGKARAYLASLVTANGGHAEDDLDGKQIVVRYDKERGVFEYEAPAGVTVTESYWFAWKAFHPETTIWKDPGAVKGREP